MNMIDAQTIERHGLEPDEYERIVQFLGREPNLTELGIFSVMWSEHCSYKSSRVHLKTLPTGGPQVLQGPGENAGAIDIGEGLRRIANDLPILFEISPLYSGKTLPRGDCPTYRFDPASRTTGNRCRSPRAHAGSARARRSK